MRGSSHSRGCRVIYTMRRLLEPWNDRACKSELVHLTTRPPDQLEGRKNIASSRGELSVKR